MYNFIYDIDYKALMPADLSALRRAISIDIVVSFLMMFLLDIIIVLSIQGIIRAIFAFFLLFILPGFFFMKVYFYGEKGHTFISLAYSSGISILLLIFVSFLLNFTVGIYLSWIVSVYNILLISLIIILLYRRVTDKDYEERNMRQWMDTVMEDVRIIKNYAIPSNKLFPVLLISVILILSSATVMSYIVLSRNKSAGTSFYILDENMNITGFPIALTSGEYVKLYVVTENNNTRTEDYNMYAYLQGSENNTISSVEPFNFTNQNCYHISYSLNFNEKKVQLLNFTIQELREQTIIFDFRDGNNRLLETLSLHVTVS